MLSTKWIKVLKRVTYNKCGRNRPTFSLRVRSLKCGWHPRNASEFTYMSIGPLSYTYVIFELQSFTSVTFSQDDIVKIIPNLDSSKVLFHDDISIRMLKICGLSKYIVKNFNTNFNNHWNFQLWFDQPILSKSSCNVKEALRSEHSKL